MWNPRWFVDDDGSVHIITDAQNGGSINTAMSPMIVDAQNAALSSWSTATQIAGTGLPADVGDMQLLSPGQSPNGEYNLWYRSLSGADYGYIGYASSASLKSGYTVTKNGSWLGIGADYEGEIPYHIGGAIWRLYMVPQGITGPWYYIDSYDNWSSWQNTPTGTYFGGVRAGTGGILFDGP